MSLAVDQSEPAVPQPRQQRLRLKRLFLWGLIISLTTCTAIAVAVLLVWKFDETTGRILGTLAAVAFHSGVAMVCADSLERRRWPSLSVAGLILFGANLALLLACIWWTNLHDDSIGRAIATTGALVGYYIVAVPCAALRERRRLAPLAWTGLAVCAAGFSMLLICIWATRHESITFGKATAIVAIAAFSLAHTCLLVRVPRGIRLEWLVLATLGCVWVLAGQAALMIAFELDKEPEFRVLGALGVMDACGSLALIILVKLRQVQKVEQLASTEAKLEIVCPRCTARQVVNAGASQCQSCGLKFRIEIEEPRCAKCDYLLWQLTQRRCPECGTPF